MITVGVSFRGHLRRYAAPGLEREINFYTVAPGTTLADLLRQIGIPPDDQCDGILNWEIIQPDYALRDGDEVWLVPPLAGGAGWLGSQAAYLTDTERGSRADNSRIAEHPAGGPGED